MYPSCNIILNMMTIFKPNGQTGLMKPIYAIIVSAVLFCLSIPADAQETINEKWLSENYTKREVMIEMRDGKSLYTSIYEPVTDSDRPLLMIRTPYSCAPYGEGWNSDLATDLAEFVRNKYIIVFQNVRGRFLSEGTFENIRPYKPNKKGKETDEASDTYDTIEWLTKNTRNNGRAGVTGMSYPGFYATMAALSGHKALKAVSPQAPILDWYKGDDVHHNGALMLLDSYTFGQYMYKRHNNPMTKEKRLPYPVKGNAYDWFLDNMTPKSMTEALADTLKFWNQILEHPDYDEFWQARSLEPHLKKIRPAILVVGGAFDTDNCYGALNTYRLMRDNSRNRNIHFVYGPWCHGCWHSPKYRGIGILETAAEAQEHFMRNIEFPFFSHYLEGKGPKPEPVCIYMSGDNRWTVSESWPLPDVQYVPVYLRGTDALSFEKPSADESFSEYVSDPASPVPFMQDASKRDKNYMAADQTFASIREDVLTFAGDVIETPFSIAGPVKVSLDLSLTSTDADIIVKLIDVLPDGRQMLVRWDVFPVRYRHGLSCPCATNPGEDIKVEFVMNDAVHKMNTGHKLMIQIQSSCFPTVNMNPQNFLENIYNAVPEDYTAAKIRIYHQKDKPSMIVLPIIRN